MFLACQNIEVNDENKGKVAIIQQFKMEIDSNQPT
jgi:hypothetical protein